jgi:4-carboxymuconolactone decarboxylase
MDRFPRIPEDQRSPEQRRTADSIVAGQRGQLRGPFVALLHSPILAERVQKLGEYLRFETKLPERLVELGILVTARDTDCANIWHSHRALALKAGLAPPIIAAIAQRQRQSDMSQEEAAVFDFCTMVNRDKNLDDPTFDRVVSFWGRQGAIDLIAVCGYYVLLAMVLNTARFPLPDGAVPFAP